MSRRLRLLPCLLLVIAAGPAKLPMPAPLPVPPIPPAYPPVEHTAPIPNANVAAPATTVLLPNVSFHDFRSSQYAISPGYAPGSQFESSEDKRPIQTPGLTWRLPLQ